MRTQKFTFPNNRGHILSGRLDLPVDKQPFAYAVMAHCFTCNKDFTAVRNISRALTSKGVAVALFDFTGLGESEGTFESTTFTGNIHDLMAACAYLGEHYEKPSILMGHSLGGAAALFTATQLEYIQAVVTIGSPFDPFHVTKLLTDKIDEIEASGKATVDIGGREFTIAQEFVEDLKNHDAAKASAALNKALLILHSPQDEIVNIENAKQIYDSASHPKSFISLDGANHLLTERRDSEYVGNVIASWVRRYVREERQEEQSDKKEQVENNYKVKVETGDEDYTTFIQAGRHHLLADEPAEAGGDDLGPTPYDLLSAALGACTTMTLQMYAGRKGWPLRSAKVFLTHQKNYATDCEHCEDKSARIDEFKRIIELEGITDEKQRSRLMEIADKCPVHKTLLSDINVKTELR